jgi:hypothetical protein
MAKQAFKGQPDAPAPAQGYNRSVHDNPTEARAVPDNQWEPAKGLVNNNDSRPTHAIPAEGQETHEGWSGFISPDKFSDQGSTPYKVKK